METLYRIVYSGALRPGEPVERIIESFSARFRVPAATAREIILSSGRTVLKHDLERARAERYSAALRGVGLLVALEPQGESADAARAPEKDRPSGLPSGESLSQQAGPANGPSQPEAPADGRQRCPKCGADEVSPLTGVCQACGVVVERYLARQGIDLQGAGADAGDRAAALPEANPDPTTRDTVNEQLGQPRAVATGRGWGWVVEAWGLFRDSPAAWIGAILLYGLISVVLSLIPFVGGLAMSILGPIFTGGLMIGAHTQYGGGSFEVKHLFAGFSRNAGPLALLGAAYLGFFILIMLVIMLLGMGAVSVLAGSGGTAGFDPSQLDPGRLGLYGLLAMLLPILIILLIMIPLVMAVLFAPTLVALNDCPVLHAFKLSFVGCWRNMLPFLVYGLVGLALLLASVLTFGLGLLVILPVMTIAIYIAYRDIYHR